MISMLSLFVSILISVQHEWTWSVHPEAGFKVLSPVSLTHSAREVPTELNSILYHQYIGGSLTDSVLAMAFVIDHYEVPLPSDSADNLYFLDFFETTIDQILTSVGGSLVYMDQLSHSDREVCIWKASYLNGIGVIRGNIIISGDKYYGIQVFGLADQKPDAIMNRFIDSFKLTEAEKP